jgi:DNA repair protein RadC
MTTRKTIKRLELHARRVRVEERPDVVYGSVLVAPEQVARVATTLLAHEDQEVIIAILLDAKNSIQSYAELARGGLTECGLLPRDAFRLAVMAGAVSMVFAHNHPSGDPTPSDTDIEVTERLVESGRLLGVTVLDHVIVAQGGGHYSMLDQGDFRRFERAHLTKE